MKQSTFQSHDSLVLYDYAWTTNQAKADIAFVHGFFEHAGRYDSEAKFFNKHGINFFSYDQRTHGLSEGKPRSYVASFKNYLKDYKIFLDRFTLGQERPYFLFAHSMGGLVQCSYLLNQTPPKNFKGAIFSAPLLMPDSNTAPLLQKLAGFIAAIAPKMKVLALDPNNISRDKVEIEKYINDPLIYTDKMYASSGAQLLKQMKIVQPQFSKFNYPFIILHGADDKLAELNGSRLLFEKSKSEDKTLEELVDNKHEITRDLDKEKVLGLILDWINKRI